MTFDPTTNERPWGLLTEAERRAINAWPHGMLVWAVDSSGGASWELHGDDTGHHDVLTYRAKPAPEQKLEVDWSALHDDVIAVTQDVGRSPELHHGIPTYRNSREVWITDEPSLFPDYRFFKCVTPADNGGPDAIVWRPGYEMEEAGNEFRLA